MSPSGIAFDHRRVQTAVIGNKNSDHPVILPMAAHELDMWRKAHPHYSYWCGIQLGGCGGELSDRRYTQKVCHFAHHPSAPVCRRTANGESSADHLFIKRGVQRLLKKQKVLGNVNTRNLGTGPGDAVDVHLPGSRRRLRFQLSSLDHRAWRRAADDLTDGSEDLDWIFGPDTPVSRELAGRHGFTLRVRCETVGGERRVHIGAEARDRTIQWTPLEDCQLTPTGLSTPHVEKIRLSLPRPKLPSFPLLSGLVFAIVPKAKVPTSSPFEAKDRHLVVADFKPADSPIVRALLSLPGDTDVPPAEHVYRIPESARMLVTDDGRGWAVEANRYVRLNAHEAQRTGLWSPPPRSQADNAPTSTPVPPARKSPEPQPARVLAPPKAPAAAPKAVRTQAELVSEFRKALTDTARRRATTTWDALTRRIGPEVSLLTEGECIALLVAVDSPLWENVPVLSALISHGDGPLPYLGDVLAQLGVQYAKGSSRLKQWAAVEVERAYAAYGQPSQAMKPRLSLSPAPKVQVAQVLHKWLNPQVPAPKRRVVPTVTKRADARISELITELRELHPNLSKPVRKRANKAILGGSVWLGELPVLRNSKRITAAGQTREQHLRSLEDALSAAHKDIAAAQHRERQEQEQPPPAPAEPKESVPAQLPSTPKTSSGTLYERLNRQLIDAAAQGRTIPILDLEGGPTLPDETLRWLLTSIDRNVSPDAPLLSALVTAPDGGPVLFFRQILKEVGLAPPETDGWLTVVWRREQQRAHAAYANPPRELLPRLIPPA
ncbi:hypothetical protein ACFCV9_02975 [Streptomyces sp. NPDC056367]|uniref:hypothetical protein n=1 Tax=Streptomyces sp. NPDC056367 TaxID=3345797 RepID=UPI0035E19A43